MFITIVCLILGVVTLIAFRNWAKYPTLSSIRVRKSLYKIYEHITLEEWERADALLAPMIAKNKGGARAQLAKIRVLRGKNELVKALDIAMNASHTYPEELLLRLEEAKILLSLDRSKEALRVFQIAEPIMNEENDIYDYALALFKEEHFSACLKTIEPLFTTTGLAKFFTLGADALVEQKYFTQAIQHYHKAISIDGEKHELLAKLGNAYRRLGNLEESEKIYRRILEKDPSDILALIGFANCMIERGHYGRALLLYQSSPAWATKDHRLLAEAGIVALRTKKYVDAEAIYKEMLDSGDLSPQNYAYYALSLESQHKWQEAEQIYAKLIRQFPSKPHGYRALAWMFGVGLSTIVSPEEGIGYAHVALKLLPDSTSWEILSACEARSGFYDRAYEIQASLALADKDPTSRLRRQKAMKVLRKNLPLDDHLVQRTLVA